MVYYYFLDVLRHGAARCRGMFHLSFVHDAFEETDGVFVQLFPSHVPFWTLFIAVLFPFIYILPSGFVYAYTAQSVRAARPVLCLNLLINLSFQ